MVFEQGKVRVGHARPEDIQTAMLGQPAACLEGFGQPFAHVQSGDEDQLANLSAPDRGGRGDVPRIREPAKIGQAVEVAVQLLRLDVHQRTTHPGPLGQPAGSGAISAVHQAQVAPGEPQHHRPARDFANGPDRRGQHVRRMGRYNEENDLGASNLACDSPDHPQESRQANKLEFPWGEIGHAARRVENLELEIPLAQLANRLGGQQSVSPRSRWRRISRSPAGQ